MHARLTATTVQAGSTVESLSELVLGSAVGLDSGRDSDSGDLDLGGPDLADDLDSAAGRDLVVGRESADADRLAVDSEAEQHAVVVFTAEVASTVAVVRTAEAVTAADTGKT
jgi:hypothetical protein